MQPRERETYREDLSSIKLCGLTLTETWHPPNFKIPYHAHKTASICLSLNGRALEIIDGSQIVTRPGSVIIRAPHVAHANQYGRSAHRGFMIELEEKWLNACELFGNVFKSHRHFSGGPVQALTMQIFRESQIKDGVAPVIVEGLMLEMLGHASRSLIQSPVRAPGF